MRNIICLLLGHRWHLERREQHYGIVETITVCDRCGDHCLGTFDAETAITGVAGGICSICSIWSSRRNWLI